ncbi:MAG TPA: aldo/keto reductase [Solirubrobacteraceae bacterium]|nr:aldo/keto reductase [Solirubrobacteraceae bacterium]
MATNTTLIPDLNLNDGNHMPQLGYGVFLVPEDETAQAVGSALQTGYRLLDTAAAYGNEVGVREAVETSELGRADIFITTKLRNDDHGRHNVPRAYEESLDKLGGGYIDLYLIHWPVPHNGLMVETWEALVELQREERVRSIGVSNFRVEDLEKIIDATGVVPAVNQIELHPHLQQLELRRFHEERGIKTEAWSPLGKAQFLDDETIVRIAKDHDRTPAQVVLRWHIQLGNIVIPKSVTPSRIEENFNVFDFELSDEQMHAMFELDRDERTGPDPSTFG